jgi:glycosyltransferase, MGT family
MHGRHIALFPLPGQSHVLAFLGLCPELIRRGCRVTMATTEPLVKLAISAGAEPVIFEPDNFISIAFPAVTNGRSIDDPKRREDVAGVFCRWHIDCAAIAVRQLDEFYRENRPDLFVYEYGAFAGRILAKRLRSPAIQYYPEFIQHGGHVCWEGSVGYNPPSIVEFSRLLDSFLWSYGFQETNNFWHSEELNFYQFPKIFQFDSDSLDSRRFCFIGPFLDRPFNPVWQNRSGGKRVILVSAVGQTFNDEYFNFVLDALSGSEYHVIISVGSQFPVGNARPLPDNFEINRYASHLEILPHTDLHLYSGGPTGTLESLYFGVPLIATPSFDRNCVAADRLAELGIVLNLPLHTLTSQMIRENVESVFHDEALLGRVKQMQNLLRSSGGSVMAVDKIDELLAGHA